MKIWLDAQLSPEIAEFIKWQFKIDCLAIRDLNLKTASDREIFFQAKENNAIVITKDSDFLELLLRYGAPPKIIWITCGNTSNAVLKILLKNKLFDTLKHLEQHDIVEISD